jgi:hypothetical protein
MWFTVEEALALPNRTDGVKHDLKRLREWLGVA